jgi:hypothetical protein
VLGFVHVDVQRCAGNGRLSESTEYGHTSCSGATCLTQDAKTDCCIETADTGTGVHIDTCSYPSQSPNSDASDCIVSPNQCTTNADCNDLNSCTDDACVVVSGPDFCRFTPKALGTTCRPSAGVCDPAEVCDGTGADCPADQLSSAGTVCRGSAGVCDVQETCTGSSAACPANALAPSTTVCRGSAGACDVAENCTGSSAACPADALRPSSFVCRASGACAIRRKTATARLPPAPPMRRARRYAAPARASATPRRAATASTTRAPPMRSSRARWFAAVGGRVRPGGELHREQRRMPGGRAAVELGRMPRVRRGVRSGGELHRLECHLPAGCEEHGRLPPERGRVRRRARAATG